MTSKIGLKVAAVGAALYSGVATAAYQLNFTRGATRLTEEIYDLHNLMMWVITGMWPRCFSILTQVMIQLKAKIFFHIMIQKAGSS